jgi:gluconolactonase
VATAAGQELRVIRIDPAFDRLVQPGAALEKVAGGFGFIEGPAWDRRHGRLLFSDIPANAVLRWEEGTPAAPFLELSGYTGGAPFFGRSPGSNGLTFDSAGRLVLAAQGDRAIVRLELDGSRTILAGRFNGLRLNSPNDLVYRSNGDLYFTDPPSGLPNGRSDANKELPYSGVFLLKPDGALTLLVEDIRAPNGIAFSPDEKTLYVSNSDSGNPVWYAFDVRPDGTIAHRRIFFDATRLAKLHGGVPDGMKADRAGNIFASGPGGVLVISPRGKLLGIFQTDGQVTNCAWGGDGRTLYITGAKELYRVNLSTRGAGW